MNLVNNSDSSQKPFQLSAILKPAFLSVASSQSATPNQTATPITTRDKISIIASKLITGVQPISAEQVNARWQPASSNRANKISSEQSRASSNSVTASVFAAAKEQRAAHRLAFKSTPNQLVHSETPPPLSALLNHQSPSSPSSKHPHINHHHRSYTRADIMAPPKPPFANHGVASPARSAKTSAPAVMEAYNDDPGLLQLVQTAARLELKENEPPRNPHPHLLGHQHVSSSKKTSSNTPSNPHHPPPFSSSSSNHSPQPHPSPSKAPKSFMPSSSLPHPSKPTNSVRDIYLSQVRDQNGKIENEKQRVEREFEKLLDTMQITPAVRVKMTGLDHPVKSAMLKSSTSVSLMNLVDPQEVHHHHHRTESAATLEDQKQEGSAWWAMYLKSHNFRELLAFDLKKLRVALRTQKPDWTKEFVGFGGYSALLKRLKELLEIEWREEQHDDQVLHEILRCCKALLLTEPGRQALGSRLPDPFIQLTGLIYSEKKPGDLATRQLIVELIQGCFELEEHIINKPLLESNKLNWNALISLVEPPSQSPQPHSDQFVNPQHPEDDRFISNSHSLVFHLLIGPPDPKLSQIVEFVAVSRRVRRFKTFVNEFIGVLMDYFWIFCHNENPFWDLKSIDEESIEAPKVPSGMTGGVEYEAMSYCTCLMRLINQLIKTSGSLEKSKSIYQDLFISGFERCLITLRKSSMNYYPMVHLELSRFIHLGLQNQFEFPFNVLKHIQGYQARPLQ